MRRGEARLLVVAEELPSRAALHHALSGLGCWTVDEAEDGATALRLLQREHYDLVISDWRLHSMPGEELLRSIRSSPSLAKLPVVVNTPVTPTVVAAAAEVGASAFLPRPFSTEKLDELLRLFIGPRSEDAVAS